MYLEVSYVPFSIGTVRQFTAANPWNNGRPTTWNIEEFVIANPRFVNPAKVKPGLLAPARTGIVSQPDGRYHLLPRALWELWTTGQIPDEKLPEALRGIEASLTDDDFDTPLNGLFRFYAYFFGLIAAPLLAFYLFSLFAEPSGIAKWFGIIAGLIAVPFVRFVIVRKRRVEEKKRELLAGLHG